MKDKVVDYKWFERVGPSTDKFTRGKTYLCKESLQYGPDQMKCINDQGDISSPKVSATGYWKEVDSPNMETDTYDQEYECSFDQIKESAMSNEVIVEEVVLVNDKRASEYSKEQLLAMLVRLRTSRNKLKELGDDVEGSKYIDNKLAEANANIDKLKALIDEGE